MTMIDSIEQQRRDFVAEARSHIGTPFEHQGRDPWGMDCGGLVVVSLDAIGYQPRCPEAFNSTSYRDFASAAPDEWLENIVAGEADPIETEAMQPGDFLLFRWPRRKHAQHLGIVTRTGDPKTRDFTGRPAAYFVHADPTEGGVIETRFDGAWLRLLTGAHCLKDWFIR